MQPPITIEAAGTVKLDDVVLSPEKIESAALQRILADVLENRAQPTMVGSNYDRTHQRHNR